MAFLTMPLQLTENPNAALIGAFGSKTGTSTTLTGRFYALKAITDVVISAITVNADNMVGASALYGVTIKAGDVIPVFPTTSVTFTGTAMLFNAP